MIDAATYTIERAICDKATAYAHATMAARGPRCNFLTKEEAAHPDYAACDNAMRGRVEQYELLTNPPERFVAYVSSDGASITTWAGDRLGSCWLGSGWSVNSYVSSRMYQVHATINGRTYTGRSAGRGMYASLRETAASKRARLG